MRLGLVFVILQCGCNDGRLVAVGVGTDAGPDAASPDATPPGAVATPRLVAPLSTATVTQQQPTLHWVQSPGGGTATVDLCADRACTQPLAIDAPTLDATSARPSAPLPPGWVYWRVRVTDGDDVQISATWQLWVGKASASTAVDTSSGSTFDVNGDGHPDLLVGAGDGNAANVFLGNGSTFDRIDLISPDGPTFEDCNAGGTCFGGTVANAGDVDGDGYADFLVGTWLGGVGVLHVCFGGPTPNAADWNGATPARRLDLAAAFGWFGTLAAAGDVNGDGYSDFLVTTGINGSGSAYLYLGGPAPSVAAWEQNRIQLQGPDGAISRNIGFGPVVGVGDVDGDGLADFVIGAASGSSDLQVGFAHLYLGTTSPSATVWNGASASRRIDLVSPDDAYAFGGSFGANVGAAGDVNGDGYADFLIGAVAADNGYTHVYFGGANRTTSDWNGATPPQRVDLMCPPGENYFGWSLSPAGDVDGDGYADFLVGAANDQVGYVYGAAHLFLGGPARVADWNGAGASARLDLTTPDGADSRFGVAIAGVGDINGDGYTDFLIGAQGAADYEGAVHLNLGAATPAAASWNGTAPAARIDLANPDGISAQFGRSLD